MSSSQTHTCLCPFSNSILMIPSTNYTHTMNLGPQAPTPNAKVKVIIVELQVQQWYKLYVEPTRGCQVVTMEEDYLESPKMTWNFELPLYLSTSKISCDHYINGVFNKFPISPGLAQYLKPFIVNNAFELAQMNHIECKMLFDVKIVKIDLVNYLECDYYLRCDLI